VLPAREGSEQRKVPRLEAVLARLEDVRHAPLADEDRELPGADDEPCAVLDLVVVARKAPDEGMPAVVDSLDDVHELGA
jgi:hypothetical protein